METAETTRNTAQLGEVIENAIRTLAVLKMKVASVTSVSRFEDGWRVTVELVERTAIPDTMDLLGVYELQMDHGGNVTCYERTRVRRRGDLNG